MKKAPYRLTERDLDLILLEELSGDTGFLAWFADRIGLGKCALLAAEHSVSAKAGAKWGETDVLAFVESDGYRIAVLIEDKITAEFADRQAARYQERAADLVKSGDADRSLTVLCAPLNYLRGVPEDDPWDQRISLEAVLGWFESVPGFRADWRAGALRARLESLSASHSANREKITRFSSELRDYLISLGEGFDHKVTEDRGGFIIRSDRTPAHVEVAWKNNQGRVDLTFSGYRVDEVDKASDFAVPEGVTFSAADGKRQKSHIFKVEVSSADVTRPLQEQKDIVGEVIAAIRMLLPLVDALIDPDPASA
ncbi:MAG: hypothetical protein OXF07_07005 [Rhodobacter sp.]|nr:hypothetical protein [Rhodobacter sp.]MCY4168294.1 hypothetical protein [Rhodobacter sp.]MCY4241827.1 hypothetical protein [Rhodobacter sp.]